MNLATLTVLAQALSGVAPRDLPALVKRALTKLERLAQKGQAAQLDRQRAHGKPAKDTKAVDVRADRAVSMLSRRLDDYALLEVEEFPRAARAAELGSLLFPDGLGFLTLPYPEQLSAMDVLMKRIDEDELAADLDAICGPELLVNLRTSLKLYRAMVQGGLQRADEVTNLQDYRRKLGAAITNYAIKVAALYDEDEGDKSAQRVLAALRPIDAMRAQISQRAGSVESTPAAPSAPAAPSPEPASATA